jgi:hypothetical protein
MAQAKSEGGVALLNQDHKTDATNTAHRMLSRYSAAEAESVARSYAVGVWCGPGPNPEFRKAYWTLVADEIARIVKQP